MELFRADRNWKDVLNIEEEQKKFFEARENGEQYFPVLKFHECKFPEDGILPDMIKLRDEFMRFDSFISKYYVENLNNFIFKADYTIKKITSEPNLYYLGNNGYDYSIPDEFYNAALKTVKTHPYTSKGLKNRDIDAQSVMDIMTDYMKETGYGWRLELNDEMLPRMNVNTAGIMRIRSTAKFSKEDIEGLKAHEVDGHIGRRYHGYQTGLHLFIHGLNGRNIYDEGLAVWNSLNKVSKPKPNILFNTAIKTIITFNCNVYNFCELFELVKKYAPNFPEEKIFTMIVRAKREIIDMSLPGAWPDDASYFCGYHLVNELTDNQREDILKYNIGPDQLDDLPKIKQFFEVNHFDPIPIPNKG